MPGTVEGPRFVMDAATHQCYLEHLFIAAFNEAFLIHLTGVTQGVTTARKMARTILALKRDGRHKAVFLDALRLLRHHDGSTVDAVNDLGGSVVATLVDPT